MLGLALALPAVKNVAWLLTGDSNALPLFQADFANNRAWYGSAYQSLGGTYVRSGNAWDRRGRKYAANVLRQNSSGILIEKSQQNFAGATSGATMFNVDSNATRAAGALAPDGETNTCVVTSTAASGFSQRDVTVTGGTTDPHVVAVSVERSASTSPSSILAFLSGGTLEQVSVSLNRATGTLQGAGHVADAGDFWRVSIPISQNGTANTALSARLSPLNGGTASATAWGLNVYRNDHIFSSPIIATATRSADNYTHSLATIGSATAKTFVVEWDDARKPLAGGRHYIASIDDGSAANRIALFLDSNGYANLEVISGSVVQCLITGGISQERGGRAAFAIDTNDVALYIDGESVGTDASVTLPSGLTTWRHGHDHTPANHLNGLLVEVASFDGRQANATLASLSDRTPDQPFKTELAQWYAGGVSGKTVIISGDSTTSQAVTLFSALTSYTSAGQPLEGVTILNRGENGSTIQAFIAGSVTYDLDAITAEAADLYVLCWGINDVRRGLRTKAQLKADIVTAVNHLRTNVPTADIVLWGPNSLLTTDPTNANYISPETAAASQSYSEILYDAHAEAHAENAATWTNVALLQKQDMAHGGVEIFPRTAPATSVFMADSLHPVGLGQTESARQLAEAIRP